MSASRLYRVTVVKTYEYDVDVAAVTAEDAKTIATFLPNVISVQGVVPVTNDMESTEFL